MIRALDNIALYDQLMPAILKIVESGGSADAALKKSEPLAIATAIDLLHPRNKPEARLQAAKFIREHATGRAVERSISVYGDLNQISDRDLDSQIMQLMGKTGTANALVSDGGKKKALKQKKKPSKNKALDDSVIDAIAVVVKDDK